MPLTRFNSSIEIPVGLCIDCPPGSKEKPLTKDRCSYHYSAYRNKISRDRIALRDAVVNAEKNKWYMDRREEMTGQCCNCPNKSEKDNDKYWFWSIAHIFEKSIFKSVATNDNNWLELCIKCHTEFDRAKSSPPTMKCFNLAKQRVQLFINQVVVSEQRRIADYWY